MSKRQTNWLKLKFWCIMCQNQGISMRHTVVRNSDLILTTFGFFDVELNLRILPIAIWPPRQASNPRPQAQQHNAITTGLPPWVNKLAMYNSATIDTV